MAYAHPWSDVIPPGTQAANTIDDEIKNLRLDTHERMNSIVRDWTTDPITGKFSVQVYRSADLVVANNTSTVVGFNTEQFDNGGLHDTAVNNSRFTIPAGGNNGVWLFHAHAFWAASAVGSRSVQIQKNAGAILSSTTANLGAADTVAHDVSILVSAPSVGDFFEMFVFQNSGGNLNLFGGSGASIFEAVHLL
jgi:hypothetical protein